ncbi:hypothetical protein BH11ARM1_BH11ARM1_04480 [soil metagenome]
MNTVLDVRPTEAYLASHQRGAIHIPLGQAFPQWASVMLHSDRGIMLHAEDAEQAEAAKAYLAYAGLDNVIGWEPAPVDGATTHQVRAADMAAGSVLDVRTEAEFQDGCVPGSQNIAVQQLEERLGEVKPADPLYVMCRSGFRSLIAIGFLEQVGLTPINVSDGFLGYPTR